MPRIVGPTLVLKGAQRVGTHAQMLTGFPWANKRHHFFGAGGEKTRGTLAQKKRLKKGALHPLGKWATGTSNPIQRAGPDGCGPAQVPRMAVEVRVQVHQLVGTLASWQDGVCNYMTNGWSKMGTQNRTMASGNMDQNLRSPGVLILTHTQIGRATTTIATTSSSDTSSSGDSSRQPADCSSKLQQEQLPQHPQNHILPTNDKANLSCCDAQRPLAKQGNTRTTNQTKQLDVFARPRQLRLCTKPNGSRRDLHHAASLARSISTTKPLQSLFQQLNRKEVL